MLKTAKTQRKKIVAVTGVFVLLIALSIGLYSALAGSFVRAAYEGRSWEIINQIVERHRSYAPNLRNLEYYQERMAMLFNFWLAALVGGYGVALSFVLTRPVRFLARYFNETSHPVNLAVFRIVFFPSLIVFTLLEARPIEYSSLPRDFLVPPFLLSGVLSVLPINPELAAWTMLAFIVACALATLGLFTRVATVAALLLGLYVLGIQQFYGKVTHYNHLIWFAALFAASPCSDTLSLDAVYRAWRHRDAAQPPAPSRRYGLPLRLTWLLMGVAYFFPGMWKIAGGGGDWIAGDILKQRLHNKWLSLDEWTPLIRLDLFPLGYHVLGAGTLFFEIFFIVAVLFPRIRPFAAAAGFSFHAGIYFFMRIVFWTLMVAYVTFVNWHYLFRRVGERFFPRDAFLVYSAENALHLGGVASLRAFDHFGRIRYLTHAEAEEEARAELRDRLERTGEHDFYFVADGAVLSGRRAYGAALARVPFLWLLWPFLGLAITIGKWLHQKMAGAGATGQKRSREFSGGFPNFYRLTMIIGMVMIVGNAALGLFKMEKAWPLAAYPSFAYEPGPVIERVNFVKLSGNGVEQAVSYEPFFNRYGEGFWRIVNRALDMKEGPARDARLAELWSVIQEDSPEVSSSEAGRFYVESVYIDPARWPENPIDRRLLAEVQPENPLVETP